MTTLDERLGDAEEALGEGPRVAPPFDALRRRHRQRRRHSMTVGATALSIVVVCVAVALRRARPEPATPDCAHYFAGRGEHEHDDVSAAPVQRLEDMPRLPASAVQTVHLSRDVGGGRAVVAGGILWFVDNPRGCTQCA